MLAVASFAVPLAAGDLNPMTIKAWDAYLKETAAHNRQRGVNGQPFLWIDESPDRVARVRRGEVVIAPANGRGTEDVFNGLIHHWIGAIFLPEATIGSLRAAIHDYDHYKQIYHPAVMDSRSVECAGDNQEFTMVWQRHVLFVNAALAARYRAHDVTLDAHRGYNVADATEVRQIESYGRPDQRLLPPDTGSGFLWRIHSLARYEERDGGVYLEVEAIALTRDIPAGLSWLVSPVVNHLSVNSLTATLRQTRDAVKEQALHSPKMLTAAASKTRGER
jgi:hypothetical protein